MKKALTVLLLAFMVLTLSACGGQADNNGGTNTGDFSGRTVDDIKAAGEIIMYTNAEFPPFEYRDGEQILGVDVDIAEAIAEDLGVKLTIEDVNFDSIITAIQAGKGDFGAAGMTIRPDRQKSVDFSIEYVTSKQYIIVPESTEITYLDDLAGKAIGVQTGTTGDTLVSEAINGAKADDGTVTPGVLQDTGASSKGYTNAILAAQDIKTGRLDAVVIDKLPAENITAANSGLKCLELVYKDGADTTEKYAITVGKGNTTLLEAINATLQRLTDEGKIDELIIYHTENATVSE